jgi:hypothetical protein
MKEAVRWDRCGLSDGEVPAALLPNDAQRTAEKADLAAPKLGCARSRTLAVCAPTLMTAAGDELGAARHRRSLRRSTAT